MIETNSPAVQQLGAALPSTWQAHWPAVVIASTWAVREAHIWWPALSAGLQKFWAGVSGAWPFLCANGGVLGVLKTFLVGRKAGA